MKVIINDKAIDLKKVKPEDYILIQDDLIKIEARLQEIVVRYFRSFVKPFVPDARLICNPFAESSMLDSIEVSRGNRVGFEPSQPDLIFIYDHNDFFSGLCIELKTFFTSDLDKNMNPISKHAKKQKAFMDDLELNGFDCSFSKGCVESIRKINHFFNIKI